MSQQNVEIVRRLNQAHQESGPSGFLYVFAEVARPDVEWREDPAWPGADTYRGVEEVRGFFADRYESFDFGVEIEDLVVRGEHVVALVRLMGRAHSTGLETDRSLAIVYTFRDGKISRVALHLDRAEALELVRE